MSYCTCGHHLRVHNRRQSGGCTGFKRDGRKCKCDGFKDPSITHDLRVLKATAERQFGRSTTIKPRLPKYMRESCPGCPAMAEGRCTGRIRCYL